LKNKAELLEVIEQERVRVEVAATNITQALMEIMHMSHGSLEKYTETIMAVSAATVHAQGVLSHSDGIRINLKRLK
jgi:hypothetical protein